MSTANLPNKSRAMQAVCNALGSGRLVKPSKCRDCDRTENIQAHHHDYTKPLDVVWLCPKCHRAEHERMGVGLAGRPLGYDSREKGRHKIYGSPEVVEAFDALCKLEGKSRSAGFMQMIRAFIRKNADKLRATGHQIPEEVFSRNGKITDTGKRRPNASGHRAKVWTAI